MHKQESDCSHTKEWDQGVWRVLPHATCLTSLSSVFALSLINALWPEPDQPETLRLSYVWNIKSATDVELFMCFYKWSSTTSEFLVMQQIHFSETSENFPDWCLNDTWDTCGKNRADKDRDRQRDRWHIEMNEEINLIICSNESASFYSSSVNFNSTNYAIR